MLSKKATEDFKKKGYTFEEIESINQGLKDIEEGNTIPFEDVIERFYKKDNSKQICIK